MTLIKTTILSGISTFLRMCIGFASNKIVAIYLGPPGIAILAQMQAFITMVCNVASAGVNNGIVKYTSEYREDEAKIKKLWSTALRISIVLIIPLAIVLVVFSRQISFKLLGYDYYFSILIILSITLVFFVLNGFLLSILNGQKEIEKLTALSVISSLVGLILTIFLVINFKLYGALLAAVLSQSIIFFITLLFVYRSNWFKLNYFFGKFDKDFSVKLFKFSLMTFTSAIVGPVSQIYLRDYAGGLIGWTEVGYWQGVWRISEAYLTIVTIPISIYYLPKLSEIKEPKDVKKELIYGFKIILPVALLAACSIFLFRDIVIKILYTEKFAPMSELFLFQLIGDVIKIASWLLGYIMIAKAMTKLFIFSEIFFTLTFIAQGVIFLNIYGIVGLTLAFMSNYIFYLIFLYFALRGYLNEK